MSTGIGEVAPVDAAGPSCEQMGSLWRRGRWALRFLLLAGGLALLAVWLCRAPDTLLARSRRVPASGFRAVGWVTDREILAFAPEEKPNAALLIDVDSGLRTPLPGLTRTIQANAPLITPFRFPVGLSPDRQWLLCYRRIWIPNSRRTTTYPSIQSVCAIKLDGSEVHRWPKVDVYRDAGVAWRSDSKGWIRFRIYDSDSPPLRTEFYAYRLSDEKYVGHLPAVAQNFIPGILLSGDRVVAHTAPCGGLGERYPLELKIVDPSVRSGVTVQPVTFPEPVEEFYVFPSPTRQQTVVEARWRYHSTGSWWEEKAAALTGRDRTIRHILWAGDANGAHLKEIGQLYLREQEKLGDQFGVYGLSPSGRRLLYALGEGFYVAELP